MPPRKGRKAPRREVAKADESRTLRECWAKLDIDDTETKETTIRFLQKLYDSTKPWNFQRLDDRRGIKEVMSENLDDMVSEVQDAAQTKESRAVHQLYRIIQLKHGDWEGKVSKKRTRPVVTTRRQRSRSQIDLSQSPLPTPRSPWLTPPMLPRERPGLNDLHPPSVQDEDKDTEDLSDEPPDQRVEESDNQSGDGSEDESDGSEPMEVEEEPQSRGSTPGESDTGSEEQEQESESESSPGSGSVNRSYRAMSFAEFTPRDYSVTTNSSRSSGKFSSLPRPPSEDESHDEPGDERENSDSMVVDEEPQSRGSKLDAESEELEQDSGSESGSGSGSDNHSQRSISVESDVLDAESLMSQEHPASKSDTQSRRSRSYEEALRESSQSPHASEEEQEESGELHSADESEIESVESIEVDEEEQSRDDSPYGSDEGSVNESEHSMNLDVMPRHRGPTSEISDGSSDNGSDNESTDGSEEGSDNESGSNNGSNNSSRAVSEIGSEDGFGSGSDENRSSEEPEDEAGERTEHEPEEESGDASETGRSSEEPAEQSDAGSGTGTYNEMSDAETQDNPDKQDSESNEKDQSGDESERESGDEANDQSEFENTRESVDKTEDPSGDEQGEATDNEEVSGDEQEEASGDDLEEASNDEEEESCGSEEEASDDDQEEVSENEAEDTHEDQAETDAEERPDQEIMDVSEDEFENASEDNDEDMRDTSAESAQINSVDSEEDEEMRDVSEDEDENASGDEAKTQAEDSSDEELENAPTNDSEEEAENHPQEQSDDEPEETSEHDQEESSCGEQGEASSDKEDTSADEQEEGSEDNHEEASSDEEDTSANEQEGGSDEDQEEASGDETEKDLEHSSEDDVGDETPDHEVISITSGEGQEDLRKSEAFDSSRISVVPNANVDIIRADDPHRPISIRLNDLLKDRNDPRYQSADGSWVDISQLHIKVFQKHLMNEGLFRLGADQIWWKSSALTDIDISKIDIPQGDENRLTELTMITTIKSSIDPYYPGLGITLGNQELFEIPRPTFTVIIRDASTTGGILDHSREPSLSRPDSSRLYRYPPSFIQCSSSNGPNTFAALFEASKKIAPKSEYGSIDSDLEVVSRVSSLKRKSPDSEVCSSDRPVQRKRASSDKLSLQNLEALQFHDAIKAQDASEMSGIERNSTASSTQRYPQPSEAPDVLAGLEFHDAMKFVAEQNGIKESESVRGPNSAGSNAFSQDQYFGKYRESAKLSPSTIEGISPPVPSAQESPPPSLLGADLWTHHVPIEPPKPCLSAEQKFNKLLTTVLNPLTHSLRQLSIQYKSPPRLPVLTEPEPPFDRENWLKLDPWGFIQRRTPPKTKKEADLQAKTANLEPSSIRLSEMSLGHPIPRTRTPAFTPSPEIYPANPSPSSPRGSPPDINKIMMGILEQLSIDDQNYTISTRRSSTSWLFDFKRPHPREPYRQRVLPYQKESYRVGPRRSSARGGVWKPFKDKATSIAKGLAYPIIRFHTISIPMANFPILFNLIPKFNIPMVSSMDKMRTVNDHARVLQERSANSPHDDSTRNEVKRLIRRTSVHSDRGESKKRREEPQASVRRKVKLLEEIEGLEKEIRWLPKFRTEQEGRVKELQERIEQLEGKEFRKKKNIWRLDDARDELARELENGWDKLDRRKRITRRLEGDDPSWSRIISPPPYRKSWDWNEKTRSTTRRRQRMEDMVQSPKSRRHPSRASDKRKAKTTKQDKKEETKVKKEDQEGDYEMGEVDEAKESEEPNTSSSRPSSQFSSSLVSSSQVSSSQFSSSISSSSGIDKTKYKKTRVRKKTSIIKEYKKRGKDRKGLKTQEMDDFCT